MPSVRKAPWIAIVPALGLEHLCEYRFSELCQSKRGRSIMEVTVTMWNCAHDQRIGKFDHPPKQTYDERSCVKQFGDTRTARVVSVLADKHNMYLEPKWS